LDFIKELDSSPDTIREGPERWPPPAVTMRHYLKADRSEFVRGLRLLEAAATKEKQG
jgi:hypothetical protein